MGKVQTQKGPIKVPISSKITPYNDKVKEAREEAEMKRRNLELTIAMPKTRK